MKSNRLKAFMGTVLFILLLMASSLTTAAYDYCEHVFTDYYPVVQATCYYDGSAVRTCVNCGYQETISTGRSTEIHYVTDYQEVEPATCYSEGYSVGYCIYCGAEDRQITSNPTGHVYGDYEIVKNPTCSAPGTRRKTCIYCYTTAEESFGGSGDHNFDNGFVMAKSTCQKKGVIRYTCLDCRTTKEESIPTSSHSYGKWKTTRKVSDSTMGKKERTCSVCGYVQHKDVKPKGTITSGDKDTLDVLVLQNILINLGYMDKGQADGDYGKMTKTAVKDFQIDSKINDSGTAFPETINKLMSKFAKKMTKKDKTTTTLDQYKEIQVKLSTKKDKKTKEVTTTLKFTKDGETYSWEIKEDAAKASKDSKKEKESKKASKKDSKEDSQKDSKKEKESKKDSKKDNVKKGDQVEETEEQTAITETELVETETETETEAPKKKRFFFF